MTYGTPNSKTRHRKKALATRRPSHQRHTSALGHAPKTPEGKSSVWTLRATEAPAWRTFAMSMVWPVRACVAGHDVALGTVYW